MDLRAEILQEHSKEQSQKIAGWIGSDKKRLEKLIDIFLHDEYRVVQRSAWIVSLVHNNHPKMLTPYMEQLVNKMNEPGIHVAVKRNVVRILQNVEIPEPLHGIVMNNCFDLLADPKETVAVRVFSMTVLDNLSKTYPEIRQELVAILNDQMEQETTAGFRSRAKKILKQAKK